MFELWSTGNARVWTSFRLAGANRELLPTSLSSRRRLSTAAHMRDQPPAPPQLPSLSQVKPGVRMLPIPLQPQQLVMRARACAIPPLLRAAPAPATLPVAGQSRSWKVTTMAHGAAAPHRPVTPGQRRRAGPRPPRDGASGPGLDHPGTEAGHGAAGPGLDRPGTALPGKASTAPGRSSCPCVGGRDINTR